MRTLMPRRLWSLAVGLPLACGATKGGLYDSDPNASFTDNPLGASDGQTTSKAFALTFPGGGTSGAAKSLSASLAPDTNADCDPEPTANLPLPAPEVQTVCFFEAEGSVPSAIIEQVVEVVGNDEWVHLRLTLNPDFVDNTYGDTAIGWGSDAGAGDGPPAPAGAADAPPPPAGDAPPPPAGDAPPPPVGDAPPPRDADAPPPPDAGAPPPLAVDAPPPPDAGAPPPPPEARPPRAAGTGPERPAGAAGERPAPGKPGRGKQGHTFRDLVGSDHAEIELLDANGGVAVHFKLDYLSESATATSGYASLGVNGGEGKLIVGEPQWILATATSIDRNLNACSLGSFVESSPETDELYTPNSAAPDWDFRVAYEVWVSTAAFGSVGFGSALIENVHASPSKSPGGDTADVLPGPCPTDPSNPEAVAAPLPAVLQQIR